MRRLWRRPLLQLFGLTWRANFRPASVLVLLLLVPLLLGLAAGHGNRFNYSNELILAYDDRDRSESSEALLESLSTRGWVLHALPAAKARELIERGDLSGLLLIDNGFADYVAGRRETSPVSFETSEDSLVQSAVRQTLVLRIEIMRADTLLRQRTESEFRDSGTTVPADLDTRYDEAAAYYGKTIASLPLVYHGRTSERVRHTIVVSDLSLIVLYLTVLAVIVWVRTKRAAVADRLASIPGAGTADFLLTYFSFLLAGAGAVTVFLVSMRTTMGDAFRPAELTALLAFYAVFLAAASFLRRFDSETGLYAGLIASFLLALFGGAVTPLPGALLGRFAQYTPHGWIYGVSIRYPVLSAAWLWAATAVILAVSARAQTRRRDAV